MDFIDYLSADELRAAALGYEDEMRRALAAGDVLAAQMWRDCADVVWQAVEVAP